MTELLIQGVVKSCETKPRGCGGLITILTVKPKPQLILPAPSEMNLVGRHRINKGEIIRASYENCSGVLWVKGYDILDKDLSTVIYSDVADSS